MKKPLIAIFVFALLLASCELTDLNKNVKDPSDVPPDPLFTDAQVSIGTFLHEVNVNVGIFQFMAQHWTMTLYTSETRYDLEGRTIAANDWFIMYNSLNDLQQAAKLVRANESTLISTAEKANKQASIEIMQALIYSELINIFGNVPYTEALDPELTQPSYDDARTIYTSLIDSLSFAIGNIDPTASGWGSSDIFYNGNMAKWKLFGNSLKLRLGMMLADVDNAAAQTVVESAVAGGVFTSNADNAMIPFQSTLPHANPVWENVINSGRQDYVPARPLVSRMNELNDPRRDIFFTKYQGTYKGGIYGELNSYGSFSHFSDIITEPGRDGMILGYAEVEFLLAEAAARGYAVGGTAAGHYTKAITVDMKFWGVPAADIAAYLAQPEVAYATAPGTFKEKIGLQKWIGLFDQYLQAYTSYRRLDAPTLEEPEEAVRQLEIVPVRYYYPVTEYRFNEEMVLQAADAIGGDLLTTPLFWDVNVPENN